MTIDPRQLPSDPLPLFPLRSVLFPGGRLALKVFEARYLDLIGNCLRQQQPFGVVCLQQGSEVRSDATGAAAATAADASTRLEAVGVLAHLQEVDAPAAGLLKVRCRGGARFSWRDTTQGAQGQWFAHGVRLQPDDAHLPVDPRFAAAAQALQRAYDALAQRPEVDLPDEARFDDAGWVANRWCELLPIPLAARQQLMALTDPVQRLELVDDYLRSKQLV